MEFIIDEKKLAGKTIESAKIVDCGEILALRFTDNSCLIVKAKTYGDCSSDVEFLEESEVYNGDLRDAGIIDAAEYDRRVENAKKKEFEAKKSQELKLLNDLRRKYPDA